jgi:type IV protein arginine methyltransferase
MTTTTTPEKVQRMIDACTAGHVHVIQQILAENPAYAAQQDERTGGSPLMAAAAGGNGALCELLLQAGAPWNAIDRAGNCAGNYATNNQHWGVVNLLVEWGTRSELILGMVERSNRRMVGDSAMPLDKSDNHGEESSSRPVEHEPCTKPDFLRQRLHYTADGQALLDADSDGVMMAWEQPLMKAHAQQLMEGIGKRVLNIGFGMGVIDAALQELNPGLHIIVEAHPDVFKRMLELGWDKKPNVRICFGKWQDCLPQLVSEGVVVDGIFYDTVSNSVLTPVEPSSSHLASCVFTVHFCSMESISLILRIFIPEWSIFSANLMVATVSSMV